MALIILIAILLAFVAGAVALLGVLYVADRRIRARHGLDTEEKVDAALAAYENRDPDADLTVWEFVAKLEGNAYA